MPRTKRPQLPEPQLSGKQFAARVSLGYNTWCSWRSRGVPVSNPIPKPDGDLDGKDWWWLSTVDAWEARRRGAPEQLRRQGDVNP